MKANGPISVQRMFSLSGSVSSFCFVFVTALLYFKLNDSGINRIAESLIADGVLQYHCLLRGMSFGVIVHNQIDVSLFNLP